MDYDTKRDVEKIVRDVLKGETKNKNSVLRKYLDDLIDSESKKILKDASKETKEAIKSSILKIFKFMYEKTKINIDQLQ